MKRYVWVGPYDESAIDKSRILLLINNHKGSDAVRIQRNLRYYSGYHDILKRKKESERAANNRVVCNHAKDISDTATGYFMNQAIKYQTSDENGEAELDRLTDAFDMANVDDTDQDNALDMSRCGVAYEYIYAAEGESVLHMRNLEPDNTFMVYDDTIEQKELFGVYYYRYKDDATGKEKYHAVVGTENYVYTFDLLNDAKLQLGYSNESERVEHHLGGIPIIEYRNNKDAIGDFEQQISLIDAYNTLTSDRVNDKEQFLDSLLVIYGAMLGDDDDDVEKAKERIKDLGLLEMPNASKAEYIGRTFNETEVETLKKAIKDDIYCFSHVPCLTDENFASNSSGVAMEYKLLGLNMITKTKERYYIKSLKKRIRLFSYFLGLKNIEVNATAIIPKFSRELPKNLTELAQMVTTLKGTVSTETLLGQIPFVEDIQTELMKTQQEKEEAIKAQQEAFSNGYSESFIANGNSFAPSSNSSETARNEDSDEEERQMRS